MSEQSRAESKTAERRGELSASFFPRGIPTLWCPPLTHYTSDGALDRARIRAHLEFVSSGARGLLVPGTTGDAWELSPEETRGLLDIVLDEAVRLDLCVLIGALHPDAETCRSRIQDAVRMLRRRSGLEDDTLAMVRNRVCGFAVCAPRGAEASQEDLDRALSRVLELKVPIGLYQLPQLTQNEMSPDLVADLARRFPNFLIFKDTSGHDRVGESRVDLGGVFLVRGMEGHYARWLKVGGGCYDGFLLAAANSFGVSLCQLREALEAGRIGEATSISKRLTGAIEDLFDIVGSVAGGNPFANAGKLADHYHAYGARASTVSPPRLHSGFGLTEEMVRHAGEILRKHELLPARGYLE